VADFIKCSCSNCGAKYRLPVEFQGRRARCKKCGEKFEVPKKKTLEDSVLDWLSEAEEKERQEEEAVARPRVISIPKESAADSDSGPPGSRRKGTIRLKSSSASGEE
jgi:PHP family Zn ribbon phosphoesterase